MRARARASTDARKHAYAPSPPPPVHAPFTCAVQLGGEPGRRVLQEAVEEIQGMPDLKHVDWAKYMGGGAGGAAGGAAGAAGAAVEGEGLMLDGADDDDDA